MISSEHTQTYRHTNTISCWEYNDASDSNSAVTKMVTLTGIEYSNSKNIKMWMDSYMLSMGHSCIWVKNLILINLRNPMIFIY